MSHKGTFGLFARLLAFGLAGAVFLALCGLGAWQIQRLMWKTDLIARVEAGLAAEPGAPPRTVTEQDEYRKIRLRGQFIPGKDVQVQALTTRGPGFWLMTPFITPQGIILVNRGFIPDVRRDEAFPPPAGLQEIVGLLRLDQPGGAFLRSNKPEDGRWFSRDTAAIAEAEGLGPVAPWFLDLGLPGQASAEVPVRGLTVVAFRNNHLGYIFTWFGLAALWAGGVFFIWRARRRAAQD